MDAFEKFLGIKGQAVKVQWERPVEMKKTALATFTKHCEAIVRAGIDYDNQKAVQEKRESGKLPAENAGLPWGEWEVAPYTIAHKGKRYLRFYPATNPRTSEPFVTKVTFRNANGDEVTRDDIKAAGCLAKEIAEKEPTDCFTVKEENIVAIGGYFVDLAEAA